MTEEQKGDRRSFAILAMILASVMGLGVVAGAIWLWTSLGAWRVEEQRARLEVTTPKELLLLVDGLRADVLDDADESAPTLLRLAREGTSEVQTTTSLGIAGAVARCLVAPHVAHEPLGFFSPRELGFHRVPHSIPRRSSEWREGGRHVVGILSHPALRSSTGLELGFHEWDVPDRKREHEDVFRLAVEASARKLSKPKSLVLQVALAADPPSDLLVELVRQRIDRFGDERARLSALLEEHAGDDDACVKAIERAIGRKRGQDAWTQWVEAKYEARVAEFDASLARYLAGFPQPPSILVIGLRGSYVAEPVPDPLTGGLSPALVRVPVIANPPNDGRLEPPRRAPADAPIYDPVNEIFPVHGSPSPWTVFSESFAWRRTKPDENSQLAVDVKSLEGRPFKVTENERGPLSRLGSKWLGGSLPRPWYRVDFDSWDPSHMRTVGVGSTRDRAVALGTGIWPWIPDPLAPEHADDAECELSIGKDGTTYDVRLAESAAGPVVLRLASYPPRRAGPPLVIIGGQNVSGPLSDAAVCVIAPGEVLSVELERSKRLAFSARGIDGRTVDPQSVDFLGRRVWREREASFAIPSLWPGRADWFTGPLLPDESRPASEFKAWLQVERSQVGPHLEGPLGLDFAEASALHALPSDS